MAPDKVFRGDLCLPERSAHEGMVKGLLFGTNVRVHKQNLLFSDSA